MILYNLLLSHFHRNFSKVHIQKFIDAYARTDNWHNLDRENGDLGYGWIHYALIRITKPKRVLVIGSKYGFIPAICALACKDNNYGMVDFVDASFNQNSVADKGKHWGGVGFWTPSRAKKHFGQFGLAPFVTMHVETTERFSKKTARRKWGYVHIDGDHSYEGVKTDFNHFWPRVTPGGFVALHDIFTVGKDKEFTYGVSKFWKELKKKHMPLLELPGEYGAGVIQKLVK